MTDRQVHAIWCDDIRQEIGNKPSFMGIYTHGIVVARPNVLPRIAIWIWVSTPLSRPFKNFSAKAQRDDGTVFAEIPETLVPETAQTRKGATRGNIMAALLAGPVEIPESCQYFEVVVQADDEEIRGPKLWIDAPNSLTTDSTISS